MHGGAATRVRSSDKVILKRSSYEMLFHFLHPNLKERMEILLYNAIVTGKFIIIDEFIKLINKFSSLLPLAHESNSKFGLVVRALSIQFWISRGYKKINEQRNLLDAVKYYCPIKPEVSEILSNFIKNLFHAVDEKCHNSIGIDGFEIVQRSIESLTSTIVAPFNKNEELAHLQNCVMETKANIFQLPFKSEADSLSFGDASIPENSTCIDSCSISCKSNFSGEFADDEETDDSDNAFSDTASSQSSNMLSDPSSAIPKISSSHCLSKKLVPPNKFKCKDLKVDDAEIDSLHTPFSVNSDEIFFNHAHFAFLCSLDTFSHRDLKAFQAPTIDFWDLKVGDCKIISRESSVNFAGELSGNSSKCFVSYVPNELKKMSFHKNDYRNSVFNATDISSAGPSHPQDKELPTCARNLCGINFDLSCEQSSSCSENKSCTNNSKNSFSLEEIPHFKSRKLLMSDNSDCKKPKFNFSDTSSRDDTNVTSSCRKFPSDSKSKYINMTFLEAVEFAASYDGKLANNSDSLSVSDLSEDDSYYLQSGKSSPLNSSVESFDVNSSSSPASTEVSDCSISKFAVTFALFASHLMVLNSSDSGSNDDTKSEIGSAASCTKSYFLHSPELNSPASSWHSSGYNKTDEVLAWLRGIASDEDKYSEF